MQPPDVYGLLPLYQITALKAIGIWKFTIFVLQKNALRHHAAGLCCYDWVLFGLGLIAGVVELQRAVFVCLKVGLNQHHNAVWQDVAAVHINICNISIRIYTFFTQRILSPITNLYKNSLLLMHDSFEVFHGNQSVIVVAFVIFVHDQNTHNLVVKRTKLLLQAGVFHSRAV